MLRVAAALLVVLGHSFPLTGHGAPTFMGNAFHTLGVKVFFVISGYLIAGSWLNDPDLRRYCLRRAARIMPGLVVVTLLGAFVLGPAVSTLGPPAYLSSRATWDYLWNIALYPVYSLPGVFADNPYPAAVNGSLWTIPVEVGLYLVTPVLLVACRRRATVFAIACVAVGVGFYLGHVTSRPTPVLYGTPLFPAASLAAYFMMGLLIRSCRLEHFSLALAAAGLLVLAGLAVGSDPTLGEASLLLTLPFLVVWLGRLAIPAFARLTVGADLSYGLYLYAFPVQQTVNHLSQRALDPLDNFFFLLPAILALAAFSWFVVEKPALQWKPRALPTPSPA